MNTRAQFKATVAAAIFFAALTLLSLNVVKGQSPAKPAAPAKPTTYKMIDGKVTPTAAAPKAPKAADPVYQVVDGRTFYLGSKGGVYEWKVSKKTGKEYKSYLSTK